MTGKADSFILYFLYIYFYIFVHIFILCFIFYFIFIFVSFIFFGVFVGIDFMISLGLHTGHARIRGNDPPSSLIPEDITIPMVLKKGNQKRREQRDERDRERIRE
jgi:hypothetical protein